VTPFEPAQRRRIERLLILIDKNAAQMLIDREVELVKSKERESDEPPPLTILTSFGTEFARATIEAARRYFQ